MLALALALLPALVPGCGEEEAEPVSIEITEPADGKARISAPESVSAGLVEITVKNSGRKPHEAQLLRIDGDHPVEEALKAISGEGKPIPDWLHAEGGVAAVPAGASVSSTQVLEEGNYYLIDVVGAEDPTQAATARLEVKGDADGDLPDADAKITASEYTFETEGLKPGRNEIEFANAGGEPHHVVAAPIRRGSTIEEVKRTLAEEDEGEEEEGPSPVDEEAAVTTAVLDGGTEQVTELELKRGRYALLCFIADRKGGPPHVAKGMVVEATVE